MHFDVSALARPHLRLMFWQFIGLRGSHACRKDFGVQAGAGRTTTQTVEATIFSTDLTPLLSLFLHGASRASWKKMEMATP